jgi:hypothetical protein
MRKPRREVVHARPGMRAVAESDRNRVREERDNALGFVGREVDSATVVKQQAHAILAVKRGTQKWHGPAVYGYFMTGERPRKGDPLRVRQGSAVVIVKHPTDFAPETGFPASLSIDLTMVLYEAIPPTGEVFRVIRAFRPLFDRLL